MRGARRTSDSDLRDRAGELREDLRGGAVYAGVVRARVALETPLVDPLADGGEAEDSERHEERPALDPVATSPRAVLGNELVLGGDAEALHVDAHETAASWEVEVVAHRRVRQDR